MQKKRKFEIIEVKKEATLGKGKTTYKVPPGSEVVPFFDGYCSFVPGNELTRPDVESLVTQRRKLYALVDQRLTTPLTYENSTFLQLRLQDVHVDRYSYWLCYLAYGHTKRWRSLESIILYWRIIHCHAQGVLDPRLFRPLWGDGAASSVITCYACAAEHDIDAHLSRDVASHTLQWRDKTYSLPDFAKVMVKEFNLGRVFPERPLLKL